MDSERVLISSFMREHPSDAARVLERLPSEESGALLAESPSEVGGEVLRRMSAFGAAAAVAAMDTKAAATLMAVIPLQEVSSVLRRIEPEARDSLIAALPGEVREHIGVMLRYREGTAGALMDPLVLVLPQDLTVGEALSRTRRRARHVYFYVYITDRNHRLTGVLDLRELLLAAASDTLAQVMRGDLAKVRADTDVATVETHPGWQEYDALPVVDEQGVFVGAIRHRAVRRMHTGDAQPNDGGTMLSLAELYWIGIGGMLRGLAGAFPQDASTGGREHA